MVTLGHASDLHMRGDARVDPNTGEDRRRARLARAWLWACEDAVRRKVRWFVLSGDVFDSQHPEPADYVAVLAGLRILVDAGVPVVLIPGNHDYELASGLSHATSPLGVLPTSRLYVLDRGGEHVEVDGMTFVGFPHPHRRALDLELRGLTDAERVEAVSRKMEEVIAAAGEQPWARDAIAVAHLTTIAARTGAERFMAMGWDVAVRAEVFARYRYACLGHIHWPQSVAANAAYPGPVDRLGFGDEALAPGYNVVDLDSGETRHVTYPEATRYLTIADDATLAQVVADGAKGAYVRLKMACDFVAVRAALTTAGAEEVTDASESFRTESQPLPHVDGGLAPLVALRQYMEVRPPAEPVTPEAVEDALRVLTERG